MAYQSDVNLAYLDGLISNRLGKINATGRGTISIADGSTSNTATITAVVTARTQVRHMGATGLAPAGDTLPGYTLTRVGLTNTTTITASVGLASTGVRTLTVGYEYTEYAA